MVTSSWIREDGMTDQVALFVGVRVVDRAAEPAAIAGRAPPTSGRTWRSCEPPQGSPFPEIAYVWTAWAAGNAASGVWSR